MVAAPGELSDAQQAVYDGIVGGPRGASSPFPLTDELGRLNGPFGLMVRFPEIGAPLQALGSALRYETSLTARAREIAILAVARATGSAFEAYAHRLVALRAGLTAAEVTAALEGRLRPSSEYEAAVLGLTEALLKTGDAPARRPARAEHPERPDLPERAVAEVVTLVGYYRLLSQLMARFGTGVPGIRPTTLQVPLGAGEHSLELELYPAPDPQAPIALYLHGGGWVSGSRTDYSERFTALAERGVSVASLDYRLATEAPYPAQREDIEAALAALGALGSDDRPLFLMGASAGATIAALAAAEGGLPVAGVIGLFGRYDLTEDGERLRPPPSRTVPPEISDALQGAAAPDLSPERRTALLAGASPESLDLAALTRLSPVARLTPEAPPMLLVHGTGDAVVDHRHSVRLAERAHRLGVPCELLLVPGANHEGPEFATPAVSDAVADFIHDSSRRPL